jgi:hypothetical protein
MAGKNDGLSVQYSFWADQAMSNQASALFFAAV